jgi:hypothetical protein
MQAGRAILQKNQKITTNGIGQCRVAFNVGWVAGLLVHPDLVCMRIDISNQAVVKIGSTESEEDLLIINSVFAENQPGRHGLSVQTESFRALDRHDISEAAGLDRRDFALLQLVGDLIAQ